MKWLTKNELDKVNIYLAEIKLIKELRNGATPEVKDELTTEINALVVDVNAVLHPGYKSVKLARLN